MRRLNSISHSVNRSAQTPGDSEGQGSLACSATWGGKESGMTEWLNNKYKRLDFKLWVRSFLILKNFIQLDEKYGFLFTRLPKISRRCEFLSSFPCASLYFPSTNLKVNAIFLKIGAKCLTFTPFLKKKKITSRNVQNSVQYPWSFKLNGF